MAGIWSPTIHDAGELGHIAGRMGEALAYRGPDDAGVWVDPQCGLALAHRRLSILDLSPLGRQPMLSAHGRYVISFNGEIYNFAQLRGELESLGHRFRGHSDTEVMLAAFEQFGLHAAVRRFVGMFAFALWDRRERTLHLVRDRLGVKPLYFGWAGGALVFASELKAIHRCPGFEREIDRGVLALFVRYGYVPTPYSIYRGVYKLTPGCVLSMPLAALTQPAECSAQPDNRGAAIKPVRYWSAKEAAERGCAEPFEGSEDEAATRLEALLAEAVGMRMVADVALGAFLSGGIDSSTIVALMQSQSSRPVKTFTIGYREAAYDESKDAAAVAAYLGTDHTALEVTPQQTMAVIPCLPTLCDEPFADPSMIPTYLLCRLTRREVTVGLAGDGGDELFGGYHRYSYLRTIAMMPAAVRNALAAICFWVPPRHWQSLFAGLGPLLTQRMRRRLTADKPYRLAGMLAGRGAQALLLSMVSHCDPHHPLVLGSSEPPTAITDRTQWADLPELREHMMHLDLVTYLPDNVLAKTDRASMAASLEARVPLLDHRVVEFAWRLPASFKIRPGQTKSVLRRVLYRYVPRDLVDRPKKGFSIPLEPWLRGPLRDWASALLQEGRLQREGYFDPAPITTMWRRHLAGEGNWRFQLWPVLMFQAWKERWC